jgi:hypothetical protein
VAETANLGWAQERKGASWLIGGFLGLADQPISETGFGSRGREPEVSKNQEMGLLMEGRNPCLRSVSTLFVPPYSDTSVTGNCFGWKWRLGNLHVAHRFAGLGGSGSAVNAPSP